MDVAYVVQLRVVGPRGPDRRIAFWLISSPEVATPPALLACPARRAPRWPGTSSPRRASRACWRPRRRTSRHWRSSVFASCSSQARSASRRRRDVHRHLPGRAGEELDARRARRSRRRGRRGGSSPQLGFFGREARRIDHRAARIGDGHHLRAQRHRLLDGVLRHVARARDADAQALERQALLPRASPRRNRPCRSRWPRADQLSRRKASPCR